jgi:hypothetical protein
MNYTESAAFFPALYAGINDVYLTSPLGCLQGNQTHGFTANYSFSGFLSSVNNYIKSFSYASQKSRSCLISLAFHHHIQSIIEFFNLNLSQKVNFSLPPPLYYFIISCKQYFSKQHALCTLSNAVSILHYFNKCF